MTHILTEAQQSLLHAAADTDALERTPGDAQTAKALIKRGYLISIPIADGPSRLTITSAGREAIGRPVEPPLSAASEPDESEPAAPAAAPASPTLDPPRGKLGALVALLRQADGTTLEAMMTATGWQAHSVRGALSGALKKKLGLTILSDKADGVRTYRIAAGANG